MLPIRFEYFDQDLGQKVYVSVLYQFKHHFTGETMYKFRVEGQSGFVGEVFDSESELMKLLEQRIEN